MNPAAPPAPSLPTLLRELRDETTTLFRKEVALARAELKDNAIRLGRDALKIAVGGVIALAGVFVLLIGLGQLLGMLLARAGVDPGVALWVGPTALGLVVTLIGYLTIKRAKGALRADHLAPTETIASLKTTKDWAQTRLS